MIKIKDYNIINWNEHFFLDTNSASGLSRVKAVCTPNGGIVYEANTPAGSKLYKMNGTPQCWQIRLMSKMYKAHRIIWVLLHGSIDNNLVIDHLDGNPLNNTHSNLSLKTFRSNGQNRAQNSNNTSCYTGVKFRSRTNKDGTEYSYWCATWNGVDNKRLVKYFPVWRYGNDLAKALAVLARKEAIDNLNLNGQEYTDRANKAPISSKEVNESN